MSDLKPSGFANAGRLEDNRNIKSLQNIGNKVTMGISAPRGGEGQIGDITVRHISQRGFRMYIKTPSGWIDVNSMVEPDTIEWRDMVLDSNWDRKHASNHLPPQYCKDSNGFVHFRGTMTGGDAIDDVFTTLPPGFRPPKPVICAAAIGANQCSVQILANGQANVEAGGNTTQQDLDGVSFFAWQTITSTGGGGGGHDLDPGSGGGALP